MEFFNQTKNSSKDETKTSCDSCGMNINNSTTKTVVGGFYYATEGNHECPKRHVSCEHCDAEGPCDSIMGTHLLEHILEGSCLVACLECGEHVQTKNSNKHMVKHIMK